MQALLLHAATAVFVTVLFCGFWFGFNDAELAGKLALVAWSSTTLYSILYSVWLWFERRMIRG